MYVAVVVPILLTMVLKKLNLTDPSLHLLAASLSLKDIYISYFFSYKTEFFFSSKTIPKI